MTELLGVHRSLLEEREQLYSPIDSKCIYDMREAGEKERLARDLWAGDFGRSVLELRNNNAPLVNVLRAQISNKSDVTPTSIAATERHLDGMLHDIVRAQNQFKIPLLTAASALVCEVNKTSREFHDLISAYHMGAALSKRWVETFLPIANACRPTSVEEMIQGVRACCFDNLSMKIDYSSYSSEGETGWLLDMTNWFSTWLPLKLAPNFDAEKIRARGRHTAYHSASLPRVLLFMLASGAEKHQLTCVLICCGSSQWHLAPHVPSAVWHAILFRQPGDRRQQEGPVGALHAGNAQWALAGSPAISRRLVTA